jgi:pyruvate/2-oxoglutarate dehydrogenase complex dihydrolipoamide acyltransferase (E2) component
LLREGVRHLWLVARSATAVPAELAALAAANGATVRIAAADVGDRAAVDTLVATIGRSGAPLAGVYHLAGIVLDATLRTLAAADVRAQLAAKLLGAFHLHAATQRLPLDAFVCFGSAAAWLGNAGQAAYAAGNGGLEGLCQWRRSHGLPAQTIAFGPWEGSGMAAAPVLQARLRAHGVRPLAPAAALAAFAAARGVDAAAVAVVQVDWAQLARSTGQGLPPRFRGLAPTASSAAAGATADGTTAPPRRAPLPVEQVPSAIAGIVAAVLGQPRSAVAVDQPLASLGLDSLLATELQHRLQHELGMQLGIGDLLAATDCLALARLSQRERATAAAPVAPPGLAAPAGDGLAAFVANLSDDEVRTMLARDGQGTAGRAKEPGAP